MKSKELSTWFKNLPNKLTLFRMGVVPLILLIFPWDYVALRIFCAFLFGLGAITDFFDGYLARRYQLETKLGAILDPISDKVLAAAAIILLTNAGIIVPWIAALIICREIAISGLRLAAKEQGIDISVNSFGKWKTAIQDIAIILLMTTIPEVYGYGMALIWVSLFLSYYSAYLYWQKFWEVIGKDK